MTQSDIDNINLCLQVENMCNGLCPVNPSGLFYFMSKLAMEV